MMRGMVEDEPAKPEVALAAMIEADLGVLINPQALRMFVRSRWSRVSTLAHRIHNPPESTGLSRRLAYDTAEGDLVEPPLLPRLANETAEEHQARCQHYERQVAGHNG